MYVSERMRTAGGTADYEDRLFAFDRFNDLLGADEKARSG